MIGNDIVDLNLVRLQCNWKRKDFLGKLFSQYEQELIFNSNNTFRTVWLLWSIKESVYKIHVQQYQERFFAPKRIECNLTSNTTSIVIINGENYLTESEINKDYIFTIASLKSNKDVLNHSFKLVSESYEYQHKECYRRLINDFSKKWNLPKKHIYIRKSKVGVPNLFSNNEELPFSLSISHHGFYGAYSIEC